MARARKTCGRGLTRAPSLPRMGSVSEAGILAANRAFYEAFAAGDARAMAALWSSGACACTHPGWPTLVGRDRVLQSWREIIAAGAPSIRVEGARALLLSSNVAIVVCVERLGQAALAATNVFVREGGAWKLAHHHAGPTQGEEPSEPSRSLN